VAIDLKTFFVDPTADCLDRGVVWVASRLEKDEDDDEDDEEDEEEENDEEENEGLREME